MFLVDTNVMSALMQPDQNASVTGWFDRNGDERMFTSAVTILEVQIGMEMLPIGRRRDLLMAGFNAVIGSIFDERVLPFDEPCARKAAVLGAILKRSGRNVGTADTQIAGIASANDATLVTRNIKDFEGLGLRLVNPWD